MPSDTQIIKGKPIYFCFGEDEVEVLFPIPPMKYNYKSGALYIEQHKKTLKDGESRPARDLGTEGQNHGEFPGLFFFFIYFRVRAEEIGNTQMLTKNPNKSLPILTKWSRKGAAEKDRKLLGYNCFPPAKHHTKTITPTTHTREGQWGASTTTPVSL